jgi:hypothetical protein
MTSWLGFQPTIDVEVRLEGEDERKSVEVRVDKEKKERCPVYLDGEGVNGQVRTSPIPSLLLKNVHERSGKEICQTVCEVLPIPIGS